jgi:hypothetical protein
MRRGVMSTMADFRLDYVIDSSIKLRLYLAIP